MGKEKQKPQRGFPFRAIAETAHTDAVEYEKALKILNRRREQNLRLEEKTRQQLDPEVLKVALLNL